MPLARLTGQVCDPEAQFDPKRNFGSTDSSPQSGLLIEVIYHPRADWIAAKADVQLVSPVSASSGLLAPPAATFNTWV